MLAEAVVSAVVVLMGVGAAVYVVLWALWEALRAAARGLGWLLNVETGDDAQSPRLVTTGARVVCRNPACGHMETRAARFCPKCGTRMGNAEC